MDNVHTLHVIYTPSEEVSYLRTEVDTLRAELKAQRQRCRSVELKYGGAVQTNSQILDYCRENNIHLPREITRLIILQKENEEWNSNVT